MDFRDFVNEEGISTEEIPEKPLDSPDSIRDIGTDKIKALKENIDEIEKLIDERETLSNSLFSEGDKLKNEITNFLLKTENTDLENPDAQRERNGLRQKRIELSELQLNEKVSCWKDIALLKRELRERQRELSERESRLKMFKDIMD